MNFNFKPVTRDELKNLINTLIEERGNKADLNDIDVSQITDMSDLFFGSNFNGNISKWNTSSVTDMSWMFAKSKFNCDISKWNTSSVTDMSWMFAKSKFNCDISKHPNIS